MKQQKLQYLIPVLALFFNFCGYENDSIHKDAKKNINGSVNQFAKDSKIGNFTCDGEGSSMSGTYTFATTNITAKCSSYEFTMEDSYGLFTCKQEGKIFNCTDEDGFAMNGCISRDGRFKLEGKPNLSDSFKDEGITFKDFEAYAKIFLVGKINSNDGIVQYVATTSAGTQKDACVITAKLEVQSAN